MSTDVLVFVIVMGSVGLLMASILVLGLLGGARQRRRTLESIAREMGAGRIEEASAFGYRQPVPSFEVERLGRRLRVFAPRGLESASVGFEWRTAPLPYVRFRRETWRDRLGKWLWLNRELRSGDREFDRAVYVETHDARDAVAELVASDAVRAAIMTALRHGWVVTTSRTGVGTQLASRRNPLGARSLEPALEDLGAVADAVRPVGESAGVRRRARGDLAWVGFAVLFGAGFLGGYLALAAKPDAWEPYLSAQSKAMTDAADGVALVLVASSYFWVRGHSRSLRNFVLVTIFGVLAITSDVPQSAWFLNAELDASPAVPHDSRVISKAEHHTRSHTWYSVRFASLFRPDGTASLDVDYDVWRALQPGAPIRVYLRDGRFGWKWVSSVERVAGSP